MTKTALITGITGQDGSYLAELLLDKGYTRSHLKGSWAGAAGKTQFMPTNILALAADGVL